MNIHRKVSKSVALNAKIFYTFAMKKKLLISCTILALTSCASGTTNFSSILPFQGDQLIKFDNSSEDLERYWVSHGYSNRGMFLSNWSNERVRYENDIAYLSILDKDDGKNYGAEIRTKTGYLYGYFGGRMKPFRHSGTVQSIFTYNGGRNRWDEIDIEFLGKDTTRVQFNYYCDGVGGHEFYYDLGFDASEDFHEYGFLWEENQITWYVDRVAVYRAQATLIQWGNFFINVWAGDTSDAGIRRWVGPYEKTDIPLETAYDYLTYAPLDNQ